MHGTIPSGLALLLLGLVGPSPQTAKTRPGWWAVSPSPPRPAEAEFAVLSWPTGPVGAAAVDPADPRTIYLGGAEGLLQRALPGVLDTDKHGSREKGGYYGTAPRAGSWNGRV